MAVPLPCTQIGVQLVVGFGGPSDWVHGNEDRLASLLMDSVRSFIR
jgi:hypothetical protein